MFTIPKLQNIFIWMYYFEFYILLKFTMKKCVCKMFTTLYNALLQDAKLGDTFSV